MANQNIYQSKFNSKRKIFAVASLLLGIISGIFIIIPIILVELLSYLEKLPMAIPLAEFVFFQITPLITIIGLILGIMGAKSTKRKFAIAGIILCVIGLLVPLYYFIFR